METAMTSDIGTALDDAYHAEGRFLWGLCYRMTGSAADADDLLQETWVRVLESSPEHLDGELGPWLVRAAVALSRDALDTRQRREYIGSWLPAPAPDGLLEDESAEVSGRRYGNRESATAVFLLALEPLAASQRAALLLRDVYGWSAADIAEALGESVANAESHCARARGALAPYDEAPCHPTIALHDEALAGLRALQTAVTARDRAGLVACFEESAELWTDANGQFNANERPLRGPDAIAAFYLDRSERLGDPAQSRFVGLNHLPALSLEFEGAPDGFAARQVASVLPGVRGRIARVFNMLVPQKLTKLNRLEQ
jgi:RNA polymerase sigma-70 factor (ECF subfamily)